MTSLGVRLMFAARNIHTLRADEGWCNARQWAYEDGDLRTARVFPSRSAAIRSARQRARREGVDHVVHDTLGCVVSREVFA